MMNNRSTWMNLKSIIIFIVLLAILAITTFILIVFVYFDHSRIDNKDEVIEFVKKSSEIKQVTDVDYFADEETYDIIYGKDENDKKYFAINPTDNRDKEKLIILKQDDVLSKENIEQKWQSDCKECTLKKSGLAMLDDEVLWELTYLDKEENYIIEYFSLEDGSTYEEFRLNNKY